MSLIKNVDEPLNIYILTVDYREKGINYKPIDKAFAKYLKEKLNKSDIKTSDDNVLTVNSPLVGVFYSSASPEADAYVAIGDRVKKGQVIGIVEAMKLMNEIESDYDGVVTDILVDNEQMVEYGQPMFVIKPV